MYRLKKKKTKVSLMFDKWKMEAKPNEVVIIGSFRGGVERGFQNAGELFLVFVSTLS